MIKYNNSNINDWNFDDSNIVKVYHNGAVCYYKITRGDTPTFDGKFKLTLNDSSVVSAECDATSAVTSANVYTQYAGTLASAEVGDCVTLIDRRAFYRCSAMTSCYLGKNITTIVQDAFGQCYSLSSITIPNSVTSIGEYAFSSCSGLTSCTIGSGVTSIGSHAFYRCSGLTSINIPSGVTDIVTYAFASCRSLTSIDIPSGVTSIGTYAFYQCTSLTSIDIPDSVTSINYYAFSGCSSLTSITCEATTPPTLGYGAFEETNCPIYVPSGSVNIYKTASGWSEYASRIQAIPNS